MANVNVERTSPGINIPATRPSIYQGFTNQTNQRAEISRGSTGNSINLRDWAAGTAGFAPNATPSRTTGPILSLGIGDILGTNVTTPQEINNHIYDFEIFLTNSFGKVLTVSPVAIQNLTINDNISEIGSDGFLVLNFDNDRAEYFDNFIFRNDGEDFLRIRLYPKDVTKNLPAQASLRLTKKLWELNFVFSIFDVQDVTPKTSSNTDKAAFTKLRKLYFKDVRRHLLNSVNIEYSTAYSQYAGINFNPEDLSDKNRSIRTGLCIDEVIKQCFNYDSVLSQTGLDVNSSEWDLGSTDLFYTSGTAESGYDLLMSVYGRHVCEDKSDISLLRIERSDGGIGYFSLKPLQRFFADAGSGRDAPGKLQIEHFFLRNSLQEESTSGRTFRAPVLQSADGRLRNDMQKDIKINDFNTIDNYEFVDISPNVNMNFYNSRGVYSFDFAQRQFNIEFNNHSIQNTDQTISGKYISKLYKRNGGYLINNTSPIKQTNKNIYPHYSPYGDALDPSIRLPDGFQKLIRNGIFQNTCINFTVPGLTIRQAGTFIGIDRLNGSKDKALDNKLCGQWFVVDVKHILAAGAYYNTITAVKIHSF